MTSQSEAERDKAVVDAFYQAGIEGHLTSFARYLDPDFKVTAPNYLSWGGTHSGAAFVRDEILPYLPDVFDFARFSYDSVIAEGGRVSGGDQHGSCRHRRNNQNRRRLDCPRREGHVDLGRLFR